MEFSALNSHPKNQSANCCDRLEEHNTMFTTALSPNLKAWKPLEFHRIETVALFKNWEWKVYMGAGMAFESLQPRISNVFTTNGPNLMCTYAHSLKWSGHTPHLQNVSQVIRRSCPRNKKNITVRSAVRQERLNRPWWCGQITGACNSWGIVHQQIFQRHLFNLTENYSDTNSASHRRLKTLPNVRPTN